MSHCHTRSYDIYDSCDDGVFHWSPPCGVAGKIICIVMLLYLIRCNFICFPALQACLQWLFQLTIRSLRLFPVPIFRF